MVWGCATQAIRPAAVTALLAIAVTVAMWTDRAAACTCADRDERDRLQDGEIGVLGRVLERRTIAAERGFEDHVYRLRVQRARGARFGREATVKVPYDGCGGASQEVGNRLAAFVRRTRGGWVSDGCSVVDPDEFERALEPYPRGRGQGRLTLLAGGRFGNARVMALDGRGRVLGYGFGVGEAQQISLCPGSRRAVELVATDDRLAVAVRDLSSLSVLWSVDLPLRSPLLEPGGATVRCGDPDGITVHAAALEYLRRSRNDPTRIFRVGATGATQIASIRRGFGAHLGPEAAYLTRSRRLLAVDLDDGRVSRLARVRYYANPLGLSPDGRWLAFHDGDDLRLIDRLTGQRRSVPVRYGGEMVWLSSGRFLFRRAGEARVYDTALRLRRRYPFYRLLHEAQVGGRVFGTDRFELRSLDLGSGKRRTVALLPDRGIVDLVGVPGRPAVRAERRAPALQVAGSARRPRCAAATRG
jgi:hypothetical protein